jgi:two-component system, OmpR family, phosphate regulon sensor histidine kinase PhoR
MEGLPWIAVFGLAVALGAALLVIRRRTDELDRVVEASVLNSPAAPSFVGNAPGSDLDAPPTAALDLLPVGVLHIGADHRITAANESAHILLGVSGRLPGRSVMEAFLDVRVEAALDAVPVGGTSIVEHRTGTAEPRTLVVSAHRLAIDDLVVVLEDVTELRRLQQIRTEFIDNLGHELRTPLSTVTLLAETLAREAEVAAVPARMRERIALIEVETGHIAQMVAEMLDLARMEGGSQLRILDDVDLARVAAASAERLRPFAERSGVTLMTDAEPDLPLVRGDEARLGQVVVNLVHNAIKFSPDGGEVRVAVRRDGDDIELSVMDHGIGIKRADRARIFERFYKADRARVRGGGTGLGLAIARHVVEGHGGLITVESEEGSGSTFTVTIPIVAPAAPPAVPPTPPPATT